MALQVVLARGLGPERFGLYAIGWTVLGLASTLAPIGMPQAMLRYGIGGRSALFSRPVAIVLLAGFAGMAALLIWPELIARHMFGEPAAASIIRAFAPALPLLGLTGVLFAALRASGRMLVSALTGIPLSIAGLALTIVMFAAHPSPVTAASAYSLSVGLALLPSIPLLWYSPAGQQSAPAARALIHFGLITMLIHSSSVLNIWADRVVIGIVSNPSTLATYQIASQFAMIMVVLRSAVTTVFEARVPKHRPGAALPDVTTEFVAATRLLLHISVPGMVVLACTSEFWVRLLFGSAYANAALPLIVLVIGQIAMTFVGPTVTALHMTGEERTVMVLMIGSALLNIVGCLALTPVMGATGAALATGIANTLVSAACLIRLLRTGRLRFSFAALRDILLAVGMCLGASLLLAHLAGAMSLPIGIAMTLAAYAVYALCVCGTCTVEDEFVQLLRPLLRHPLRRLASL